MSHQIKGLIILILLIPILVNGQIPIKIARTLPVGSVVTISGIVTTGEEFGVIRYMQDAEAGIAVYSTLLSETDAGDSIIISGVLSVYQGQLQIAPVTLFEKISTLPLPDPIEVELEDPSINDYESMRVTLSCMGISTCRSNYNSDWMTVFNQDGISVRMLLENNHSLISALIPEASEIPLTISGIFSRRNDQIQILGQNIIENTDPHCRVIDAASIKYHSNYGIGSLAWKIKLFQTNSFFIQYGPEEYDSVKYVPGHDGEVEYFFDSTEVRSGLIYKARLRQYFMFTDTTYSLPVYFTPKQPEEPHIEVYFNRSINSSFSDGSSPTGTGSSVIETKIIEKINSAVSTLDVAMYNTTAVAIVQALIEAKQRGVQVRYIADDETSNSGLSGITTFPIFFRSGDGIMHNKFIIGDADIPGKAWVCTGSTNISPNQLNSDPNNAFFINEQSLAQNYKREFEEMWGQEVNHDDSRSGDLKADNTCHEFKFESTRIESYFSPSDETNCHILEALGSANHTIDVGLLLLTKEDIVDELITLHSQKAIQIRIILEDEESSSEAVSRLRSAGIEVRTHDFSPIFHHKYAIIDEGYPESDPMVITGSHNWTFSADNINDENTLIIHQQSFANIFRQEFEARWQELQNTSIVSGPFIEDVVLYPNPASDFVEILNLKDLGCELSIFDSNGKLHSIYEMQAKEKSLITLNDLAQGIWILQFKWESGTGVSKLVIQP